MDVQSNPQERALRLALLGSCLALLGLAALALACSPAAAGAIIDNGVVQLGVDDEGQLNVPGGSASMTGVTTVGVRYMATGAEATAPGCLCEGWGLGYDGSVQGYANNAGWPPVSGITLVGFTSSATEATSVVLIGDIEVTQHYFPSPITDFVYQNKVTLRNTGSVDHTDVTYRRTMDWDVEPTPFSEYSTIQTILPVPEVLQYSCTNGFASDAVVSYPLSSACSYYTIGPRYGASIPDIIDAGPSDHGAAFDFNFGGLGAGDSRQFDIYYGAADTEVNAYDALTAIDAEVWSLGQPSSTDGSTLGVPNTFIFAFGGLNLSPPKVDFDYEFTTTGTQLAPPAGDYLGPYNLTVDPVAFIDHVDLPTGVDGLTVYRNWTFGDGGFDFVRYPLHTYMDGDNSAYGKRYTVCENITVSRFGYLKYAQACKDIGVHNRAPVPHFRTVSVGENKVRFLPSGTDLDGVVVRWQWDLGDGTSSNMVNPGIKAYPRPGQYRVCLVVTDDDGSTGETCGLVIAQLDPSATDGDGDGVPDGSDNCPTVPNPRQLDTDHDFEGDDCDGIYDESTANFPPTGFEGVTYLNMARVRDVDSDQDGVSNNQDNCVDKPNKDQVDLDLDGLGDACDGDLDGDGILQDSTDSRTLLDNCFERSNPDQLDTDGDGLGDACDPSVASVDVAAALAGSAGGPGTGIDRSAGTVGGTDRDSLEAAAAAPARINWVAIAGAGLAVGLGAVGLTMWASRRWT